MEVIAMETKRKGLTILTRLQVIKRDKCTCQVCGKRGIFFYRYGKPAVGFTDGSYPFHQGEGYNGPGIEVFEFHHVKPIFLGGYNELDNIQLTCRKCNRGMGYLTEEYTEIQQLKKELAGES